MAASDVEREPETAADGLEAFHAHRDAIRAQMGGADRVEELRAAGRATVRQRIDRLLDAGTFREVGTFTRSANSDDAATTPGDGKIGGHGRLDGRPVTVLGDDITVKRGSSSLIGSRRIARLFEQAVSAGNPFLYLGETGGARIPDTLGSAAFSEMPPFPSLIRRGRRVPMATAIVGESFGGSSFISALSDFVVQVEGSCLAVTSPRVIEMATGEPIEMEELGGVEVGAKLTGQIDLAVPTDEAALQAVRSFLSYLPSNAWSPPPLSAPGPVGDDPEIGAVVPARRSRAYDMRRLLERVLDADSLFELKPDYGRSLITGLGRLGGQPIGVIASQPRYAAGALTPPACDKATRLVLLCDAFSLPLVLLQDTPGFMVGGAVEHDRILSKAMLFAQALVGTRVPKLGIVVRKAFGLAFFSMGGPEMGMDHLVAWPGAEIGFMDPHVGANVLVGGRDSDGTPRASAEEVAALAETLSASNDPMGPAGAMTIDEVIDPAQTRRQLVEELWRLQSVPRSTVPSPLASWPTCW